MEFTHTPFPKIYSAASTERYGHGNPTRPYAVVAGYLEDLIAPYLHLVTLNTTLEKLEKDAKEWVLTLRRSGLESRGQKVDYWWIERFDAVIVASVSYPFIQPDPVTESGRLQEFYQHTFKIGDPTLAVVGQVRAALTFRCYEYQAVAVARVFAGRGKLPSILEQKGWEAERLEYEGPTALFHEIAPDFGEYFEALRIITGSPANGTDGYELPPYADKWVNYGLAILELKNKYVRSLEAAAREKDGGRKETLIRAKL
ncbi:hypothetical protein ONS96_007471 [Cadophora gregata f. sp. sojae]|nr:hypothetical protein ONS96_007471 [Cadophora gregata f. sp. sojae]